MWEKLVWSIMGFFAGVGFSALRLEAKARVRYHRRRHAASH